MAIPAEPVQENEDTLQIGDRSTGMPSFIVPERFSSGDFCCWLRHFKRCAQANEWDDATQLLKLPAFLQGPAATYFDSLPDGDKVSLDRLATSLQRSFSPATDRERYYREFEDQRLRPAEDPNLFLWRLKECLRNAEPDLSATAFDALLRRQFLKGLPGDMQLKMLEHDPTPTLAVMTSFAQRFRSLKSLPLSTATCAAVAAPPEPQEAHGRDDRYQQQQHQLDRQQTQLDNVSGLLGQLADGQSKLIAAISSNSNGSLADSRPPPNWRVPRPPVRCFNCGEEGHIVRFCRKRKEEATRCTLCSGWGHVAQNCANNLKNNQNVGFFSPSQQGQDRKFPLNYQGVPR